MLTSVLSDLPALIATYGYGLILVMVMLESLGLPLPGEATLITASIYAGATHDLALTGIIAAAVSGAVIGDNIGFWIGEKVGSRLLIRVGPSLGITPAKVKLGQYLFMKHGGKVVFFGRFVAVLRVWQPSWPEPTRCPGHGSSSSTSRAGSSGRRFMLAPPMLWAHGFTPWQARPGSPRFSLRQRS